MEEEEDVFKTNKKVPLQFNKVATIVNTLVGEQQQNTPQLQVVPMENCDQETAKLRELIIKDIMLSTNAKTVYQVAAEQSFVGGFGAFIIATDYINNKSFDLDIVYRYVKDPTRCYWDVSAETINKTDGMYAGYLTRMSRQKFREVYGKDIEKKILYDQGVSQIKSKPISAAVSNGKLRNPKSTLATMNSRSGGRLSNSAIVISSRQRNLVARRANSPKLKRMADTNILTVKKDLRDNEDRLGDDGRPRLSQQRPFLPRRYCVYHLGASRRSERGLRIALPLNCPDGAVFLSSSVLFFPRSTAHESRMPRRGGAFDV